VSKLFSTAGFSKIPSVSKNTRFGGENLSGLAMLTKKYIFVEMDEIQSINRSFVLISYFDMYLIIPDQCTHCI